MPRRFTQLDVPSTGMVLVEWRTPGVNAIHTTAVPEGEDYRKWISEGRNLHRDDIVIDRVITN